MSGAIETAATDPRVRAEDKGALPQEGVVLPDWNAERDDLGVQPQIDNNAVVGVVIDRNITPAEAREPEPKEEREKTLKEIEEYERDEEDDWIGARRGADAIDLPQSRYLSPDLTFKDPPDLEEPYEATVELEEQQLKTRPRPSES